MLDRLLGHQDEPRSLEDLAGRGLNFELRPELEYTPRTGWHIDVLRQPLPAEPPGAPVPDGAWEAARALMRDYAFAEGSSVRAVYDRDGPLEGRDMLLRTRFWHVLRFNFPVRIGEVADDVREEHGRRARVWGWNYRTLDGHLEMGQMAYEVWKWLDSGEVEFRITAFSRRADIRSPIVRLGVRLFARREQLKFYRHVCEQMRRLTAAAVSGAGVA